MSNRNVLLTAAGFAAALLASAACGAGTEGPPAIELDRTSCAHCGMLISETVYAAAFRDAGGQAAVFDDIGCLVDRAREAGHSDTRRFWFHDATTREWIAGDDAVFVKSPALRTPMGGGVLAYRDSTAAARAAAEHRGEVWTSVAELFAKQRPRGGGE